MEDYSTALFMIKEGSPTKPDPGQIQENISYAKFHFKQEVTI